MCCSRWTSALMAAGGRRRLSSSPQRHSLCRCVLGWCSLACMTLCVPLPGHCVRLVWMVTIDVSRAWLSTDTCCWLCCSDSVLQNKDLHRLAKSSIPTACVACMQAAAAAGQATPDALLQRQAPASALCMSACPATETCLFCCRHYTLCMCRQQQQLARPPQRPCCSSWWPWHP